MFEVKNNLAPKIMKNIFYFEILRNSLRNNLTLQCKSNKTIHYRSETIFSLRRKNMDDFSSWIEK